MLVHLSLLYCSRSTYSVESFVRSLNVKLERMLIRLLLRSKRDSDLRCFSRSTWITEMSFESKYSSVVSAGMPLGISLNALREQRTTVPRVWWSETEKHNTCEEDFERAYFRVLCFLFGIMMMIESPSRKSLNSILLTSTVTVCWTITFAEASLIALARAFELVVRQLLYRHVFDLQRRCAACWRATELSFSQPVGEPG